MKWDINREEKIFWYMTEKLPAHICIVLCNGCISVNRLRAYLFFYDEVNVAMHF